MANLFSSCLSPSKISYYNEPGLDTGNIAAALDHFTFVVSNQQLAVLVGLVEMSGLVDTKEGLNTR